MCDVCIYTLLKGHSFHMSISFVVIISMICARVCICVSMYVMEHSFIPFPLLPPQSVDDCPVLSDKGRAAGEHGTKNAVKLQLN